MSDDLSGNAPYKIDANDRRRPSDSSKRSPQAASGGKRQQRPSPVSRPPPSPSPGSTSADTGGNKRLSASKRASEVSFQRAVAEQDTSGSISVATMESAMSRRAKARATAQIEDEPANAIGNAINIKSAKPWFFYRLVLACLLGVFVCVACFMMSCQSFRYESWDDGTQYYGIRGVSDQTTGRCIHWQIQDVIDWNQSWTHDRMPRLFVLGFAGVVVVVVVFVAWVAYGIILKSKRDRRKVRGRAEAEADSSTEKHMCGGPIGPAVIIGACLIGAGLLIFVTVMGNCSNIPPVNSVYDRGLRCNLHNWSVVALVASVALCTMGGTIAFFLKCCCNRCFCTTYLHEQLIDS